MKPPLPYHVARATIHPDQSVTIDAAYTESFPTFREASADASKRARQNPNEIYFVLEILAVATEQKGPLS